MSTSSSPADSLPLTVPYLLARISVDDYHKLISSGALKENSRIELLRGVLVEKERQSPLLAGTTAIVQRLFMKMLAAEWMVRTRSPVTLFDSEPEPDISITRGALDDLFGKRHPGPAETPLVIEIGWSSLVTDRYKAEIYAEARIPWYWIVNLPARRIEVFSQPIETAYGLRYRSIKTFRSGDSIPIILDGQEIGAFPVAQIFPVDAP
jgi:Uma2 family endonuclease